MSEHSTDEFTSLEDLFRSSEFGRPRAEGVTLDQESDPVGALFGGRPVRAPLVPLAPVAGTPVGVWGTSGSGIVHSTTTHIRRNRTFAAVSGAAAALLVAVGLAGSLGHSNKPNLGTSAIGAGYDHVGPGNSDSDGESFTPTPGPGPSPSSGSASSSGAALGSSARAGGTGNATVVSVIVPVPTGQHCGIDTCGGGTPTPPPTSVTKPTPPAPPATAAKTGVLPLVGSVVTTVGTTVNGLSKDINTTVPALTPVGNLVAPVGGTVVDLGDVLSGLSA